jgi:hypothetical protein
MSALLITTIKQRCSSPQNSDAHYHHTVVLIITKQRCSLSLNSGAHHHQTTVLITTTKERWKRSLSSWSIPRPTTESVFLLYLTCATGAQGTKPTSGSQRRERTCAIGWWTVDVSR